MTAIAVPHIDLPAGPLSGDEVFERVRRGIADPITEAARAAREKVLSFMAGFSDVQENVILDSVVGDGGTNLNTAPVYMALCTTNVTETDTGSTIVQAAYTGYARQSVAAADLSAAAGGSKTNGNAIVFAACTAGTATVVSWAFTTASTAGQVILFGTCPSVTISSTQTPATVNPGAWTATLD
jgi:hypothetical protein